MKIEVAATSDPEVENLVREVGDFYTWSRDYWIELGRGDGGAGSGMLNFGLWQEDTHRMFDAQQNLRRLIVRCLGELPPGARGLDIGCGIGGAAIGLVQERAVAVTCMDLVPAQLEIGRDLAHKAGVSGRIEFRPGSSMDMPFQDGVFDFSYCIESSFHYQIGRAHV